MIDRQSGLLDLIHVPTVNAAYAWTDAFSCFPLLVSYVVLIAPQWLPYMSATRGRLLPQMLRRKAATRTV